MNKITVCKRFSRTRVLLPLASMVLLQMISQAHAAYFDDFEDLSGWSAMASPGVALEIAHDQGRQGLAMRLDFDFHRGGGYIIARKKISIPLPASYAFSFYMRGETTSNTFEFKLIDPSNQNVWLSRRRDFEFPKEWEKVTLKDRHFEFAQGPDASTKLKEVGFLEIAIAAGTGGKGSIWIDHLSFEEREPLGDYVLQPLVQASTSTAGHQPDLVLDGDAATRWKSGALAEDQWVLIDFQKTREYGGLVIDWDEEDYARTYDVEVSDNASEWQKIFSVASGKGGRDYVYLPDAESRYLRLNLTKSSRSAGYGVKGIEVKPYQFSASPNKFFEAIALDSAKGTYPRYFLGQQSYWTVVGVDGDDKKALLNEDGMIELHDGRSSIEPFLYSDGQLITWSDVKLSQELDEGYLPIPSVMWVKDGLQLKITALAAGAAGTSSLYLKYQVQNESSARRQGSLFLALRPFRVNSPWQALAMNGGATRIREMVYDGDTVFIDKDTPVISLTKADRFGAARFEQGGITEYLTHGDLPKQTAVHDGFGYASGALEFRFDLPPGAAKGIHVLIPFYDGHSAIRANGQDADAEQLWADALETTRRTWRALLNRVSIELPAVDQKVVDTLKTTLAYILINADGPAIQPGPRAYKRSWIRDGALMSAALLRMGHADKVREFIRWYARYQFEDGRIPCCVDWGGADRVAENDSNGEWIYLVAEYYRYSRDIGMLMEMWPQIVKAVDYIDFLRQQRMTDEYRTPEKLVYYGLVPESVSHEGYMPRPVHSYWDDFFTLLGLKDAARLATIVGDDQRASAFAQLRDAFRQDLYASIKRSLDLHHIDFIPGAAELGDFDFTSTVIAVDPAGELANLPEPAFAQTFKRYYQYFTERKEDDNNEIRFQQYSPYELRIVGPLVQMGRTQNAHELLDFFLDKLRPPAWNLWAEAIWRDPRAPGFIGDMPHTWCGGEFIRSARSLFAYERESDQALVIGAGLTEKWVMTDDGVAVKRLPTYYGTLNYVMRRHGDHDVGVSLSGDVNVPSGKIVIASPLSRSVRGVTVNGASSDRFSEREAVVGEFPANVVLHY